MCRADVYLIAAALATTLILGTLLDARLRSGEAQHALGERARLVKSLELTDLALFTEARYTRHPTQADPASAFQDLPMGLDLFPSGSLVAPPFQSAGSEP